jgi:multidomain signaling protein FimX
VSENAAVPLVVVSAARDPVEALNSLLRRQGVPAHCTWIPGVQDLPEALEQLNPEMLVCVTQDGSELATVAQVRDRIARDVPLLVIRATVNEGTMAEDMALGARDSMTLDSLARVYAVIARELKACRMERALHSTLRTAHDYRQQLESVLTRSNDAIAQVQEGIVVDVNASWLELIAAPEAGAIVGQPVMDLFEDTNHAALKGALVACQQGRWNDHSLKANILISDGSSVSLEIVLSVGERDGEPCVLLIVPAQKRDDRLIAEELAEAVRRNPHTGLFYRQPLLEAMLKRCETPVHGGSRYLLAIRPDEYAKLESELGVFRSEELIIELSKVARAHLNPNDILGHFSGAGMLALTERGTARDAELWAERLVEKVNRHIFQIGGRTLKVTVCVGLAAVPNANGKLEAVINDALEAARRGRKRGGNQVSSLANADADARVQAYDAVWVKHIKAALEEGRFRLVQQPIASLGSGATPMYDMLVRMLDGQGKEVLPSEFMPAAERNDLVRHIDRWVITAAAKFAVRTNPGCLFVRVSRASAVDPSLMGWIDSQLRATKVEPKRLCIEITEDLAARFPQETQQLAKGVRERGLRFALEHFGAGIDPHSLLGSIPLDFVKIDGSLMQGLPEDPVLQAKVRSLVDAAKERKIETIAERVEDANTMAVLWQIGVQHLQGYLIQAPEEVVMGTKA